MFKQCFPSCRLMDHLNGMMRYALRRNEITVKCKDYLLLWLQINFFDIKFILWYAADVNEDFVLSSILSLSLSDTHKLKSCYRGFCQLLHFLIFVCYGRIVCWTWWGWMDERMGKMVLANHVFFSYWECCVHIYTFSRVQMQAVLMATNHHTLFESSFE